MAWLTVASLERSFPFEPAPQGSAEAIVVLGANHYPSNPSVPESEPGFSTYMRTAHAAWLFHHWRRLPVIVSGGTGGAGDPRVAELMARQLIAEGVPASMISVEGGSRDTHENAVETARILLSGGVRRIALVTEAYHMPRAERTFRKQGFEVTRAPCCYRVLEQQTTAEFLLPREWAVRVNSQAWHEIAGLAWYKLRGRI